MDFSLIHKEKLRVVLSLADMAAMGLAYEAMNLADTATRAALIRVLEEAGRAVGFRPKGAKLFIEAYSRAEEGCVLYITLLPARKRAASPAPVLFRFNHMESLIRAAGCVRERLGNRTPESTLYRMQDGYRLAVQPQEEADRLAIALLSEFGDPLEESALTAAQTEEHGQALIQKSAIEVLAGLSIDN